MMNCRICGNTKNNPTFNVREMQFGTRQQFEYFQCSACQCLQIDEIPADMSAFYPAQYYSARPLYENKYQGLKGFFRCLPLRAALYPANPIYGLVSRAIPNKHFGCLSGLKLNRTARILDVGCGNGKHFIYPLHQMGFDNVAGCDPFIAETLNYKNGLTIVKKTVLEMAGEACWDLITFHHSFEHIPNPGEALTHVARLLAPKGHCVVRIPTSASHAWRHYGVDWVQLDAPRHLYLHSVASMNHLARAAGLTLLKTTYDSDYFQFFGSENYRKDIPLKDQRKGRGIFWQYCRWKLNRRAKRLNRQGRGDQAVFVLAKSDGPKPPAS